MSEAAVQAEVRLKAAKLGILLFRNNSGAFQDDSGRWCRFGLANDSSAMNKVCKSSDLVGIGPGGIFHAYEVKHPSWRYTGTPREVAQKAFLDLVIARGGIAKFITSPEDLP